MSEQNEWKELNVEWTSITEALDIPGGTLIRTKVTGFFVNTVAMVFVPNQKELSYE